MPTLGITVRRVIIPANRNNHPHIKNTFAPSMGECTGSSRCTIYTRSNTPHNPSPLSLPKLLRPQLPPRLRLQPLLIDRPRSRILRGYLPFDLLILRNSQLK